MSVASISETVSISFASQCDRGKVRKENQDSVLQTAVPLGDLLIVADGIGGYAGGGIASRVAAEIFSSALAGMPTFFPAAIAIQEAARRANAEIAATAAQAGTAYNRMGTTVVLALLQQKIERTHAPVQAWIGHIGDSRAYRVHQGRLSRITRDHSAMQLLIDRNLITPEAARRHPDSHVLTRSLGHEPDVEIELNEVALEPGDSLLLCSDGLWGFVPEPEIERVLADRALSVEDASRALLNLALEAGGHDNVGIEIARLAGTSESTALTESPKVPVPITEPPLVLISKPDTGPKSAAEVSPQLAIASVPSPWTELARALESKPKAELEFDYVPKFANADPPGSSFVNMLVIMILAFAMSAAFVYTALVQNWFGMDHFLQ